LIAASKAGLTRVVASIAAAVACAGHVPYVFRVPPAYLRD
jgi:hypothetical protein